MVNFNFIKKIKKCILDNMIMIHHSEKLSNRKKLNALRMWERARVFFQNGRQKIEKNPFFFLFIWPSIHIYTKNEVFRYKTTQKKHLRLYPPLNGRISQIYVYKWAQGNYLFISTMQVFIFLYIHLRMVVLLILGVW